jgi:diguanylate cyclase (GGDEF)-like protein
MAGGGWVATYEDVTERQQAEARIRFMAHHDALTGLPNRTLLHERIEAMLHATPRQGRQLVVFCLDLDHFKNVNDSLGHPAGDALLQAVAGRLRHCVRDEDLIARLGGDEFAILYVATDYPAQAEQVAQRIVATLCEPYEVHGTRAIIGVSIGITLADADSTSADLLKNADLALYRAKGDGRGTYRFFEQEMEQEVQDRRTMELDLREAVSSDRFVLYYQPLFSLTSNRVSGFEALLRWDRPGSGLVSPASFVPLAEEIGLIHPIGEWVLRRAFRDAAAWPYRLKVAVNLSPEQFRDERLVELVQQALEESGLPATCVELEITESTLLQDNEKVVATLHRLRQLGVHIALDDFGTGYSSLSYLRSFPFDKLKIDQSFVREMAIRPDCRAIVNSISALASQLHITTTAEGVETEEHLAQIRAAGCTEAQGYYFSTPLPAASVGAWLASHVASGPTVAPSLGFMGATGRKRELLVSSAAAAK